jgi:hypothetical protein
MHAHRRRSRSSSRPVIVVFYADRDEKSWNLATLARSLAADFSEKIGFYGYRASDATGKMELEGRATTCRRSRNI